MLQCSKTTEKRKEGNVEANPSVAVVWDRFFFPTNRGAKNIRKDALVRQLFEAQNSHENSGENAIL